MMARLLQVAWHHEHADSEIASAVHVFLTKQACAPVLGLT